MYLLLPAQPITIKKRVNTTVMIVIFGYLFTAGSFLWEEE